MTYKLEQRSSTGRITYEAKGTLDIWSEVLSPGIFIWFLLLLGSLGIGFLFVANNKIPTHNDLWSMIGIALTVSSASSLGPLGLLWGTYQSRVRPYEDSYDYVDEEEVIESRDNIWQQTGPSTIARTKPMFSNIILHDLALNCFNADGTWKETEFVRREPFQGIGIAQVERKYEDIKRELARLGWMIKVDSRYRWTSRGKRELWKHYPPTAQGLD
jgi:hypothetical protein